MQDPSGGESSVASIDVEKAFAASDVLRKAAQDFRDELLALRNEWEALSSTWQGVAASAYEPPWLRWQTNAATLVDELAVSADAIGRTAYQLDMQDRSNATGIAGWGR